MERVDQRLFILNRRLQQPADPTVFLFWWILFSVLFSVLFSSILPTQMCFSTQAHPSLSIPNFITTATLVLFRAKQNKKTGMHSTISRSKCSQKRPIADAYNGSVATSSPTFFFSVWISWNALLYRSQTADWVLLYDRKHFLFVQNNNTHKMHNDSSYTFVWGLLLLKLLLFHSCRFGMYAERLRDKHNTTTKPNKKNKTKHIQHKKR